MPCCLNFQHLKLFFLMKLSCFRYFTRVMKNRLILKARHHLYLDHQEEMIGYCFTLESTSWNYVWNPGVPILTLLIFFWPCLMVNEQKKKLHPETYMESRAQTTQHGSFHFMVDCWWVHITYDRTQLMMLLLGSDHMVTWYPIVQQDSLTSSWALLLGKWVVPHLN
jgi:hypothetical protein